MKLIARYFSKLLFLSEEVIFHFKERLECNLNLQVILMRSVKGRLSFFIFLQHCIKAIVALELFQSVL